HQAVLGSDPAPDRPQYRHLSQEPRRHHDRVLHRSRHHARRGAWLFRTTAVAPGRSGRRSGETTPRRTIGTRGTRTTCRGRRNKHHCAFAPVSRINLPHSAISSTKNCAACAGVLATGSSISSLSFALTSGCRTISTKSLWIFSAVAADVPGGAAQADQVIERKPGQPDSAKVGTCGHATDRSQ